LRSALLILNVTSVGSSFLQLTGAVSHVLPIMLSVMVSKWVGDAFGQEGIYASWIALRGYPWLPTPEYRDTGETAAALMKSIDHLIVVRDGESTAEDLSKRGLSLVLAEGSQAISTAPR
jgi:hypothetical protein